MKERIKPGVLAPAGDFERLQAAVKYGADAVYLGATSFGMRANAGNFDEEELRAGVKFAHDHGVRVYLTCNILPTNEEADQLEEFLLRAADAGVDALIVADVGILMMARRLVPQIDIHISTQTGVVNYLTANELYKLGAKRVVLDGACSPTTSPDGTPTGANVPSPAGGAITSWRRSVRDSISPSLRTSTAPISSTPRICR